MRANLTHPQNVEDAELAVQWSVAAASAWGHQAEEARGGL